MFFQNLGIGDINAITPKAAEDYMAYRKSIGIKQNTNATFMNALRAYLIFCNKRGYANKDINMFETPRRVRTRVEFITGEEVNQMLSYIHRERDRLIILILYTSGARVSELMQVSVENLRGNSFHVVAKGNKPHVYYFDETVAARLQQYIAMENITHGPVFRTTTGKPIGTPAVSHLVRKAAKLANISKNVHPHLFRHGFATALLENGSDVRTTQEILGHENIQTTMRYMHVTDQRIKESHEKFAPKVSPPTPDVVKRLCKL